MRGFKEGLAANKKEIAGSLGKLKIIPKNHS